MGDKNTIYVQAGDDEADIFEAYCEIRDSGYWPERLVFTSQDHLMCFKKKVHAKLWGNDETFQGMKIVIEKATKS